jgi:hypothetical protein
MRRRLAQLAAVVGVALALGAQSASAATAHLSGGGTASHEGQAFSQVAFNVSIDSSGSASGSFECLMAGRSKGVLGAFKLEHNMIVHATPMSGSIAGSVVTFDAVGTLKLDGSTQMSVQHVHVWVNVATQQFELSILDLGAMGVMPVETFSSGGVQLR